MVLLNLIKKLCFLVIFIYDYYTAKFIEAVREEDYESKHYFDNEI